MTEHSKPAAAPATAGEWLVALREAPDDAALQAAHRRWLAADGANAREWEETRRVWSLLGAPDAAAALQRTAAATPVRPRPRRLPRLAAAAAALAACLALFVAVDPVPMPAADHATAGGETRRVQLADGSVAVLAPRTALDVALDASGREVTLRRGTAFFEVAPDPERPFAVTAGGLRTTVLGTAFEVSRSDGTARVAVEHGRVRVDTEGEGATAVTLEPGQAVRAGPDGAVEAEQVPASLVASWRNGRLAVRDRPVGEVVEVLRGYFDGWIVVTDAALAQQTVTGLYDLSDARAALAAVADAQGADVRQISPWLLVLSGADRTP